ncbi:variable large family protein [Borrelia duttonii]|nr:variable large family protein [Borrelia duttonii]
MGCNSGGVGGEEGKNKFLQSLVNVSEEFLNVFTSFGDMVGSVLGLNVNSKKSDVGKYFKTVQETVEEVKTGLNKIVAEMKEEKNPNAEATEAAVKKLVTGTFDKIIEGAKTASEAIGTSGDDLLGNVAAGGAGAAAGVSGSEIDSLVKGIKGIVDVVLKGVGKADAGDNKKAEDGNTARTVDSGAGKLFADDNAGADVNAAKKVATDAAKAVGAVTGADILQAMIKDGAEASAKAASAKDGTIAGAILLRAISKGGKFANANAADAQGVVATAIKNAAVSSVTKALDTLTIGIRKTIDSGLKEVKEAMKINANATHIVSNNSGSDAKN